MASALDLQEQEQLDQLKAFWQRHGNWMTWVATAILLAFAAYNGWNWWQREQAVKATGLQSELERVSAERDAARVEAAWKDLQSRFPGTVQAQQGALLASKTLADLGRAEAAVAPLQWLAEKGSDASLKALARVRWAGLLLDRQQAQAALDVLTSAGGNGFDALVEDRRADAYLSLGKPDAARESLQRAWSGVPEAQEYRRVLEAKLMTLGVDPATLKTAASTRSDRVSP